MLSLRIRLLDEALYGQVTFRKCGTAPCLAFNFGVFVGIGECDLQQTFFFVIIVLFFL